MSFDKGVFTLGYLLFTIMVVTLYILTDFEFMMVYLTTTIIFLLYVLTKHFIDKEE